LNRINSKIILKQNEMNRPNKYRLQMIKLVFGTVLLFCFNFSFAQPVLPQKSITIQPTQSLHFGTFCVTGAGGGIVTVGYDGARTSTGEIILINVPPLAQPAIFEIKLCQGRNVSISFDPPNTLLTGPGGSMSLKIGPTDKGDNGAKFVTNSDCNFITPLRVGGTLTVPGSALPGTYTGSFAINFIYQ
jgi:hypothetical protein